MNFRNKQDASDSCALGADRLSCIKIRFAIITRQKLYFLIKCLGRFQVFRNNMIFVTMNLPVFRVLIRTQENLQKYFTVTAMTQSSIPSNAQMLLAL